MRLSDYNFTLPKELVAQDPLGIREASRMLTVDRGSGSITDGLFVDFPALLNRGDLLVLNNTKVFPARLVGRSETGANVELFLVEEIEPGTWVTLARPARRLKPGKRVDFGGRMSAEIVERLDDGKLVARFETEGSFDEVLDEIGRTPLPPYIERGKSDLKIDRERYQTVFAKNRGAIAAPTAGLHFSPPVFQQIAERGVEVAEITLHVGYGTFEPVRTDEIEHHKVAAERFEISEIHAEKLKRARQDGRRIVAVGTTTTRTLEYIVSRYGDFRPGRGQADLTILPDYRFQAIGALLTNFHLPESSLLILVATFGGYELIMKAYRHAVESRYRFYSYGDCMFVE